jgi:hypothetical protein
MAVAKASGQWPVASGQSFFFSRALNAESLSGDIVIINLLTTDHWPLLPATGHCLRCGFGYGQLFDPVRRER